MFVSQNFFDALLHLPRACLEFLTLAVPSDNHLLQKRNELRRREIGGAEERLTGGQKKIRHRPTALSGHQLHAGHIDLVDVWILFSVHLNANKVLVENGGDLRIVETLDLHNVTPMTGRITNR